MERSPRLIETEFDPKEFEESSLKKFDHHMLREYTKMKLRTLQERTKSTLQPSKVSRSFLNEVEEKRAAAAKSVVGDHSIFIKKEPRKYVLSPSSMGLKADKSEILEFVKWKNSQRNLYFGTLNTQALPSIKNSINLNSDSM